MWASLPTATLSLAFIAGLSNAYPTQLTYRTSKAPSKIIVFGDSFSDNGNGSYRITNHTWPADPAYYKGRFSNGPTWIEDVASNLGLPLYDYAIGGSTSNNSVVQGYTGFNSTVPVPSAADRFNAYLSTVKKSKSKPDLSDSIFVVLTGANDVFFNPNVTAQQSVATVKNIVTKLRKYGAKDFVLASYSDLSRSPLKGVDAATLSIYHSFTLSHRAALLSFRKFLLSSSPKVNVAFADAYDLFQSFFSHPSEYGFNGKEIGQACLTGAYGETPQRTLCSDPDERVYWDEFHPTRKAHKYFGEVGTKAIKESILQGY